jgi:drug/metabolite transporter (DMT)-like permease
MCRTVVDPFGILKIDWNFSNLHAGLGEILALMCALTWASAVVCMRKSGEDVDPVSFNIFKIGIAIILFLPTIWLAGESPADMPRGRDFWQLVVSGAIGIGIADTLWLTALRRTSASTIAILDCAYSPTVVILSACFLREQLTVQQGIGAILVIGALGSVVFGRSSPRPEPQINGLTLDQRSSDLGGAFLGILSVILMALAVVMMKPILDRSPLFTAIEIRCIAGFSWLVLTLPFLKRRTLGVIQTLRNSKHPTTLWLGAILASYVAMIFWVGGTKYAMASVGAILNQTSTIFVVSFAAAFLGEPVNKQKVIACIIGFTGAGLVFFGAP